VARPVRAIGRDTHTTECQRRIHRGQLARADLRQYPHQALAANLGWRGLFAGLAAVTLILVWSIWRQPDFNGRPAGEALDIRAGVRSALRALQNRNVLRWLALLALGPIGLLVGLPNLRQNSPHLGAGLSKNRLNL